MPHDVTRAVERHTLLVHLHDRPGALYRAIGLIRRRDYNVSQLFVAPSGEPGRSRMRLVVEAHDIHQVKQQLARLIDVISVESDERETPSEAHDGLPPP